MKNLSALCFIIVLLVFSSEIIADPYPAPTSTDFWDSFDRFFVRLAEYKRLLLDPSGNLYDLVEKVAIALSIVMIVLFFMQFIYSGVSEFDLFILVLSILGPKLLLDNYGTVTTEGWSVALGIANNFQETATGSTASGGIYGFLDALFDNISITGGTLNPFKMIVRGAYMAVLFIVFNIFMGGVALATMWAVWGYSLASIIGLIFVPLSITPITRPFFMSWVSFYIGYLLYVVIARLNLVILYLLTISIFNLPADIVAAPGSSLPVYTIDMNQGIPTSLTTLMVIGILSMFSIGSMTASLVAGGGASFSSGMGRFVARRLGALR